jgi:hypothetical protein
MFKLLKNEKAKFIHGYDYKYMITDLGRVWSSKSKRFLNPTNHNRGYLHITLSRNGRVKKYLIHRLIAIYFIPNPNKLPEVNHKDGNKRNINIDNLEWATNIHNRNHAMLNRLTSVKHKSKFHGVSYTTAKRASKHPWIARVKHNKTTYWSTVCKTDVEAALAYNQLVKKLNLDRPLNNL